jgi:isopenicillin N synthase-like dioxygenase
VARNYALGVAGIPVINLQGDNAGRLLDRAWREVGFAAVTGHSVDLGLFAKMRSLTQEVFSLREETKQRFQITAKNYRGFVPFGFFSPNRGEVTGVLPDAYEAFKLHWECPVEHSVRQECALYGNNQWLSEVAGMEETVLTYWSACDDLANLLLALSAAALDLDPLSLSCCFTAPLTNMTLLHYPTQPAGADFGIHPHKDTNVFTLLHPDPVGGLEVLGRDGSWISVNCPPEALLINTGEMMEVWSGGHYAATPHRVINRGPDRFSFPYFMVPNHDVVVKPLVPVKPSFVATPMPVGVLTAEVWRTNWRNQLPVPHTFALGSLRQ